MCIVFNNKTIRLFSFWTYSLEKYYFVVNTKTRKDLDASVLQVKAELINVRLHNLINAGIHDQVVLTKTCLFLSWKEIVINIMKKLPKVNFAADFGITLYV